MIVLIQIMININKYEKQNNECNIKHYITRYYTKHFAKAENAHENHELQFDVPNMCIIGWGHFLLGCII